jgi:hypothetical protein
LSVCWLLWNGTNFLAASMMKIKQAKLNTDPVFTPFHSTRGVSENS